jgi:hypothetical protein
MNEAIETDNMLADATPAPLDPNDPVDAQLMEILALTPRENYRDLLRAMQRIHAGEHPFDVASELYIALGLGDVEVSRLAHLVTSQVTK